MKDLMEKILALPLADQNFIVSPVGLDKLPFSLTEFVPVAMRLLSLDSNLSRIHAKLVPRMNEELFWQNYHYRITYLRAKVGMDESIMPLFAHLRDEDLTFYHIHYNI